MLVVSVACQQKQQAKQKQMRDSVTLPVWDTTIARGGYKGYIDSFVQDGVTFRLIHHEGGFDGIVQKNINASWTDIFSLEKLSNGDDYDRLHDINGDGFPDLVVKYRWFSIVYFYSHDKKTYLLPPLDDYYNEWKLLDKNENIYCGESIGKGQEGNSALYTFKGNVPYYYYQLVYYPSPMADDQLNKIVLYKCANGEKDDTMRIKSIPLPGSKSLDNFNYFSFWNEFYKKRAGTKGWEE